MEFIEGHWLTGLLTEMLLPVKKWSKVFDYIALCGNACQCDRYHVPYAIAQCYLPLDTSEHVLPYPSQTGRYLIYLSQRDGNLELTWVIGYIPGARFSKDHKIYRMIIIRLS